MDDIDALFDALRQTADPDAAEAIRHLVREGSDAELARLNPLAFAASRGLDEEDLVSCLLHAARLGLFEMSWNILCPSCAGVLDANATLKSVRAQDYHCAFCALSVEPALDDDVEVSFAVSPRTRRIAAHDPGSLAFWDYHRQIFFSSRVAFAGDGFDDLARKAVLEAIELGPGERMILALDLPAGPVAIFDPVTHSAHTIAVGGEPTRERQDVAVVLDPLGTGIGASTLRPGPVRLSLENRAATRALPGVFRVGRALEKLIGGRRPFLSAKRLLCNQTFRDIYRTDTLTVDQRLKILSMTFLFTDLKGSTELYERVGDLVAYDLVREHFRALNEIVASEGGAVVKTIGDAVMATFPTPQRALSAALRMRDAMRAPDARRGGEDLVLKIGLHVGPCLAVNLNDRQDFFGQTVNIAARVQDLAMPDSIVASEAVLAQAEAARLLADRGLSPRRQDRQLRGIGDRLPVFELS